MEIEAYAKINLTLEALGRRPDGYHEVRTVLQTIDLADRLQFEPSSYLKIECATPGLGGEDDLVWRAADALRRATGCDRGVKIRLEKHIPIGMGLGGGSSDAAATLRALNALWELDLSDAELLPIAASLGSDAPFFLRGGTALGEGRGEEITHLPPIPQRWMVLLCPSPEGRGMSVGQGEGKTARLYSMLTQEHYTDGTQTRRLVDDLGSGRLSQGLLYNVFKQVGPSAFHGFERAQKDLIEAGARSIHLSGTGPSLYTFMSCKEDGERILKSLKGTGLKAYCISTVQPDAPSADVRAGKAKLRGDL